MSVADIPEPPFAEKMGFPFLSLELLACGYGSSSHDRAAQRWTGLDWEARSLLTAS